MKLLLDTHIFLWYVSADSRLKAEVRNAIRDPLNDVYLSVASVWESVVKYSLGKLPLPEPPDIFLPRQRASHRILSLPVEEAAMGHLRALPPLHRDPFDRMLIAQAIQLGLTLVSEDTLVRAYSVPLLPIP